MSARMKLCARVRDAYSTSVGRVEMPDGRMGRWCTRRIAGTLTWELGGVGSGE